MAEITALHTSRLTLRVPDPADAGPVFETFAADLETARYLAWKPHGDVAETQAFLISRIDELQSDWRQSLIVAERASGRILGMISRRRLNDQSFRIAYVIGRSFWGRGYATEAADAFVRHLLQRPGVSSIEALCDVHNHRSARVLTKLGMTVQGIIANSDHAPNLGPELRDARRYVLAPVGA